MYPTLLQIGSFKLDSYSVIWFIALSLAILWAVKRLSLYNLDEDESRRIMAISFFFMLLGARAPEYFRNFSDYVNDPSLLLDLNHGGLEEGGAIMGAFFSALILCVHGKKVSFLKLCEVAAIPAFLAICVGRWGCFLNGCCAGLESHFVTAIHFPYDKAGVTRHPTQIYYSVFALASIFILLYVEKKNLRHKKFHSVVAPLALILYGIMRFSIAIVREPQTLSDLFLHYWKYKFLLIAFPLECLWLVINLRKINSDKNEWSR